MDMSALELGGFIPPEELAKLVAKERRKATLKRIRCVDERQALDTSNGVEIPGATYGLVDALKALEGISEDQAWNRIISARIPVEAHIDEGHGERGCGYAKLVEDEPGTVLAVESIPALQRLQRVYDQGGQVATYIGEHAPRIAVTNEKKGWSLDPDQAPHLGAFSFDAWAAEQYGRMLRVRDPRKFKAHLTQVYQNTVRRLAPQINRFHVLK